MDLNNPYSSFSKPWAIFRLLSVEYRICFARFRTRADAEAYERIFRDLKPHARFEIIFDPPGAKRN